MIRALSVAGLLLVAASAPVAAQPASAPATPSLDPAGLAAARALALKLVPPGTYQRMMANSLKPMMGGMFDQALDMPARQLLASFGLPAESTAKLSGGTIRQIMSVIDPAFEQRMKLTTATMFDGMGELFATIEPDMREGMAEAYAGHFDAAQLAQINAFFATPTGSAFAGQQMTIMTDPAIMKRMQAMFPLIMKQMPVMMKKVEAATASLPKPKKEADLTEADRQKLAALLGVTPDKLKAKAPPK